MDTSNLDKEDKIIIKHKGFGKFDIILEDGTIKEAGPNLCGMIRYTYFEDYSYPPDNWQITNKKLIEDYFPKASKDILAGKLKPNQMNY